MDPEDLLNVIDLLRDHLDEFSDMRDPLDEVVRLLVV
jgi:hypothetical protein